MKNKIVKWLLPLFTTTGVVAPTVSLTSCGASTLPTEIKTAENSQFAFKHEFEVVCKANSDFPSKTNVGIISSDSSLTINSCKFSGSSATVSLKINGDIHYDKKITYSLVFEHDNKTLYVDNLIVFYVFNEEDLYEDEIICSEKTIQNTGKWTFNFRFQFSALPNGNITPIIDEEDDDSLLTVPSGEYKVVKESQGYFLTIPVQLNRSVTDNRSVSFSIVLQFTNSFGILQQTSIGGLCCTFIQAQDTIPAMYYKIDKNGKLSGFTDYVMESPEILQQYTKIQIPPNVTEISDNVFNWIGGTINPFENIREIILGKQTTLVGKYAFLGCKNLEVLDLSNWEGEGLPKWLTDTTSENVFDYDSIRFTKGFAYVPEGSSATKTLWATALMSRGLKFKDNWSQEEPWSMFYQSEISEDDWFITETTEDGEVVLTGIDSSEATEEAVKACGLIKIPDSVTKISLSKTDINSCFQYFGTIPSEVCGTTHRRILLSNNLKMMENNRDATVGLFENAGLCSGINIPPYLKEIPNNCFKAADKNTQSDSCEPLYINFGRRGSLEKIGDYAFAETNMNTMLFPSYFANQSTPCKVGKLVFENSDLAILDLLDLSKAKIAEKVFTVKEFGEDGSLSHLKGSGTVGRFCVIPNVQLTDLLLWFTAIQKIGLNDVTSENTWNLKTR